MSIDKLIAGYKKCINCGHPVPPDCEVDFNISYTSPILCEQCYTTFDFEVMPENHPENIEADSEQLFDASILPF